MSTEPDDEPDDAAMAQLLARFGAERRAAGGLGFEPPPELFAKLRALESAPVQPSARRYWLAAAAVLAALTATWWFARRAPLAERVFVAHASLGTSSDIERGSEQRRFASGEVVHVRVRLVEPAVALLALLDSLGRLAVVRAEDGAPALRGAESGLELDWAVELDDQAGEEAFVVLVAPPAASRAELEAWVDELGREIAPEAPSGVAAQLERLQDAARRRGGAQVLVLAFEHVAAK